MTIPRMGVLYTQLTFLEEKVSDTGVNEIRIASYVDAFGEIQTGFYKTHSDNYVPLVSYNSVSASQYMRLLADEKISEDRLVLDDEERPIGTISLTVPNYKPMYSWGDTPPEDEEERRLVCPNEVDLVNLKIVYLLLAKFLAEDDDLHNKNLSALCAIDHDRTFLSWAAILLEKGRPGDGWLKLEPYLAMVVCSRILDNFPNFLGQTYSPTNFPLDISVIEFLTDKNSSLNINFKHIFWSYKAFQNLAKNPDNGVECFQDQLLSGCLHMILASEDLIRVCRVQEAYLSDVALNFTSFHPKKQELLCKLFPTIFSKDTSKDSYVDMITKFFAHKYEQIYKTVTLYLGCEKNKFDTRVMGFCEFLENRPSAFRSVRHVFVERNKRMGTQWEKYQKLKEQGLIDPKAPLPTDCLPPEFHYDLERTDKLYHQIWRDSHIPFFRALLSDLIDLFNELLISKKVNANLNVDPLSFNDFYNSDESQFNHLELDHYNGVPRALLTCLFQLTRVLKDYVPKDIGQLTLADNVQFNNAILEILTTSQMEIKEGLKTTEWVELFASVTADMELFCEQFNLSKHLTKEDVPLNARSSAPIPALMRRDHSHPKVVKSGIIALFDWANEIDRGALLDIIKNTLEEYKSKSTRCSRSTKIGLYLKHTQESGADMVAYILSEGGFKKTSSLNSLLLNNIMRIACEKVGGIKEVSLFSIKQAMASDCFKTEIYVSEARKYACTHLRFNHAHSKAKLTEFNKAMYSMVKHFDTDRFQQLLIDVLKEYKPATLNILSKKKRMDTALAIINNFHLNNADKVSRLFSEGEFNPGSLNVILFDRLKRLLVSEIPKQSAKQSAEVIAQRVKIFKSYDDNLNRKYYLTHIAAYATAYCKMPTELQLIQFNQAVYYWIDTIPANTIKQWLEQHFQFFPNFKSSTADQLIKQNWSNSETLAKLFLILEPNYKKDLFEKLIHFLQEVINAALKSPNIPKAARDKAALINQYKVKHQDFYFEAIPAQAALLIRDKSESVFHSFYKLFYGWVNEQTTAAFTAVLKNAMSNYLRGSNKYLSLFGQTKTRSEEIKIQIEDSTKTNQQKIMALFSKGNINEDSLNNHLFKAIVSELTKSKEKFITSLKLRPDFSQFLERMQQDAAFKLKEPGVNKEPLSDDAPIARILLDTCLTH